MKAIVVADRNWAIGNQGRLLVHLPGDLKYFKERTLGNVVVMGRATLASLPGGAPLPGRTNIVLSRNSEFQAKCTVCSSVENLLKELEKHDRERVFIIGGGQVYQQLLPYCHGVYVTKIDGEFPADTHFEDLDKSPAWSLVWESEPQEENGVSYRFTEYQRVCT